MPKRLVVLGLSSLLLGTRLAGNDLLAVLVELEAGDNDVAGVNADGGSRPIRLVSLHTVNVDNPFLAVDLSDFSLTSLVFSPDNANLVILANGQ